MTGSNGRAQREVLRGRRADMEAFDSLPPEVRVALREEALPFSAIDIQTLLQRTPAPVVIGILAKSRAKRTAQYRARVGLC